jgi:hypothetical protein
MSLNAPTQTKWMSLNYWINTFLFLKLYRNCISAPTSLPAFSCSHSFQPFLLATCKVNVITRANLWWCHVLVHGAANYLTHRDKLGSDLKGRTQTTVRPVSNNTTFWPCHSSGGKWPASQHGDSNSLPGQFVWYLWWHWDRFLSEFFDLPLSVSFQSVSPLSPGRWTTGPLRPQFRDTVPPHRHDQHHHQYLFITGFITCVFVN